MADPKQPTVAEPFPILRVADRFLIYDVNAATYIRREYHICGVLIGTIPQVPQQNVFLGMPLELMPEEAKLLVEKSVAFIVDDVQYHKEHLEQITEEDQHLFIGSLEKQGREIAEVARRRANVRKEKALNKLGRQDLSENGPSSAEIQEQGISANGETFEAESPAGGDAELHSSSVPSLAEVQAFAITPTTTHPPLPAPSKANTSQSPLGPSSYPLYAHLHSKGYFISPGLRFGCQYLVYPGDPLRFHSHFLAVSAGWDEEFDLLDLVGGGRLGTGVKKGYLLGAVENAMANKPHSLGSSANRDSPGVRTFCVEWGGM